MIIHIRLLFIAQQLLIDVVGTQEAAANNIFYYYYFCWQITRQRVPAAIVRVVPLVKSSYGIYCLSYRTTKRRLLEIWMARVGARTTQSAITMQVSP